MGQSKKRGDRRTQTERKIKRRLRDARTTGWTPPVAHKYHKKDTLGHCSNRGCFICAGARHEKRKAARALRHAPIETDE